jgi:signal transduction histidine kinase
VDRSALSELVHSAHEVFRIPVRIIDAEGVLVAGAVDSLELYAYLDTLPAIRGALNNIVKTLKTLDLAGGELTHPCVTGALYRIAEIRYDGRAIGRIVVGPFAPPDWFDVSPGLLDLEPSLDPARVRELLPSVPRAGVDHASSVARYLSRSLDLILFAGHKALLTGNMHLAAMRESYRELQDKNARLQQAFDRLKELDRLKSNFLATVSHELRTPLTSIIGYSEMLAEGIAGPLAPEQAEFVQTIREKGEQLLELIKGLLDLSKLESGTMSLRKADIPIASVIEDVAQTLAPAAKKKGVYLGVRVEPGLPQVWADKERMRQVLLNLTENALKFTPAGGSVRLGATLTAVDSPLGDDSAGMVLLSAKRTAVEVRVADTGIGIPASERERVFDAFYQVDSSSTREQGGTGLGLSIVKRLVDAHDGSVRIEDNDPRGTVFVVTIPCRRVSVV